MQVIEFEPTKLRPTGLASFLKGKDKMVIDN